MGHREDRLKEIVGWLEIKGVEINKQDIEHFKSVINLATKDGFRLGTNVEFDCDK